MSAFLAQHGAVVMIGQHAPWRMSEVAVDSMLDLLELEGHAELFNDLWQAAKQAYGEDMTPRVTSIRGLSLVVNNTAQDCVRHMLSASVELEAAIAAKAMEQTL